VGVSVAVDLDTALKDADAAVVMTEWPEFSALTAERLIANMRVPIILDQNGFLDHLAGDARIRHIAVGRATRGRS
jgi:UDPglucose 6-dehydrogenase